MKPAGKRHAYPSAADGDAAAALLGGAGACATRVRLVKRVARRSCRCRSRESADRLQLRELGVVERGPRERSTWQPMTFSSVSVPSRGCS